MYKRFFKRILDVIGALLLLLIFGPVMIVITIALFFAQKRVVFFKQRRPGLNEKPFLLWKFSTMMDDPTNRLSEKERITWIGNFLRKTSLDELPQLFHVLKGEMSLIGPRPLLMDYLPLYSDVQRKRHDVLPGITGWAQVKGRNTLDWDQRFTLDVYYAQNISLFLDLKILFLTIFKAASAQNVYAKNGKMMEPFKGNK